MTKKKVESPAITWQVGDGPVHEIPEGADVTFHLQSGGKQVVWFDLDGALRLETRP